MGLRLVAGGGLVFSQRVLLALTQKGASREDAYRFVQGEAPPTVNPSLWRQAKLNAQIGLFKVVEGVWQLRGFDIGNMTLVQGRSGWIVIDALTCRETAAAAIAFSASDLDSDPA